MVRRVTFLFQNMRKLICPLLLQYPEITTCCICVNGVHVCNGYQNKHLFMYTCNVLNAFLCKHSQMGKVHGKWTGLKRQIYMSISKVPLFVVLSWAACILNLGSIITSTHCSFNFCCLFWDEQFSDSHPILKTCIVCGIHMISSFSNCTTSRCFVFDNIWIFAFSTFLFWARSFMYAVEVAVLPWKFALRIFPTVAMFEDCGVKENLFSIDEYNKLNGIKTIETFSCFVHPTRQAFLDSWLLFNQLFTFFITWHTEAQK